MGQEHSTAQSIPPSPGNWLQTERFEVAGQEVYREAGKPAGSRQAQCMFSACSVAAAYSAAYSAACSMQGMFSACSVCHSSSKFQQAVRNNAVIKQAVSSMQCSMQCILAAACSAACSMQQHTVQHTVQHAACGACSVHVQFTPDRLAGQLATT